MTLESNRSYQRINNIIYDDSIPIIKLYQKSIDLMILDDVVIAYMNRYLQTFPDLWEPIDNQMKIIKVFYDVETTGTNVKLHGIHQISGCIEINDVVVEKFNFKVRPNQKAQIEAEALAVCNVTEEQIKAYPEMIVIYRLFVKRLSKYIDRFNPKSKAYLVGYNNRKFDDIFLRAWFEQNGDTFFGSWFWSESLDVIVLAGQYLLNRRLSMPSFKLRRVALELGIQVDEERLHDAEYDIYLTREIYRIVVGLELEI